MEVKDYSKAYSRFQEALTLYQKSGHVIGKSTLFSNMGDLARCEKRYDTAKQYYIECLTLKRELGAPPRAIGVDLFNLGQTYLMIEQIDQAVNYFKECFLLGSLSNSQELLHCALEGWANVSSALQEPERAARLWGAAETLTESVNSRLTIADRLAHDHFVNLARKQMDMETFDAALVRGRKMTMEEAVDYARALMLVNDQ